MAAAAVQLRVDVERALVNFRDQRALIIEVCTAAAQRLREKWDEADKKEVNKEESWKEEDLQLNDMFQFGRADFFGAMGVARGSSVDVEQLVELQLSEWLDGLVTVWAVADALSSKSHDEAKPRIDALEQMVRNERERGDRLT